jgi:serine/threonine protein phosphatase 1
MVNGNNLLESQNLSRDPEALAKHVNSAWLHRRDELGESQWLINTLYGISLLVGDRKAAKLEELKARYGGTQIERLLRRLFD